MAQLSEKLAPEKQAFEKTGVYYDALQEAVRETPLGRWFLEEFARRQRGADTERVMRAISKLSEAVSDKMENSQIEVMRRELQEMSTSIVQTRREIAAIKPQADKSGGPQTPGSDRIVAATEELDYVVKSTAQATDDILSTAERIQAIGGELRAAGANAALCDEMDTLSTNLMLACSFQDLTGQRMTKVVNALRYIEQRVNSMIEIWGVGAADGKGAPKDTSDKRPDAHLLNGPAKEGEGVSQADIDKMLNGAAEPPKAASSQDDIDALFK